MKPIEQEKPEVLGNSSSSGVRSQYSTAKIRFTRPREGGR